MNDSEKLIKVREMLMKARADYINEFADFVNVIDAGNPEDLKRAQYLHGKADAICTAYIIINNIINDVK